MSLTNCRILVTGASRGVGRAISEDLLAQGAIVGAGYHTSETEVENLVQRCPAKCIPLRFDVTDPRAVQDAVEGFSKRHGGLDGIILCAGVTATGLLIRQETEVIQNIISVNVGGAINCIKSALPHLLHNESSFVLTFSSVAVERPISGMAAYSASKGAVESLSRSLAAEYLRKGIDFVCIRLGPTDTDMWRSTRLAKSPNLHERLPEGAMLPSTVAHCIVQLLVSQRKLLTGEVIRLDRGFCLT